MNLVEFLLGGLAGVMIGILVGLAVYKPLESLVKYLERK
jgi:hypothetical protein